MHVNWKIFLNNESISKSRLSSFLIPSPRIHKRETYNPWRHTEVLPAIEVIFILLSHRSWNDLYGREWINKCIVWLAVINWFFTIFSLSFFIHIIYREALFGALPWKKVMLKYQYWLCKFLFFHFDTRDLTTSYKSTKRSVLFRRQIYVQLIRTGIPFRLCLFLYLGDVVNNFLSLFLILAHSLVLLCYVKVIPKFRNLQK